MTFSEKYFLIFEKRKLGLHSVAGFVIQVTGKMEFEHEARIVLGTSLRTKHLQVKTTIYRTRAIINRS